MIWRALRPSGFNARHLGQRLLRVIDAFENRSNRGQVPNSINRELINSQHSEH